MSQRHKYRDLTGTLIDVSDHVPQQGWAVQYNAEEGSVGSSRITIDDPDMDMDFTGHRRWLIIEDESESSDEVLWAGYTAAQDISRGYDADSRLTLGRVWTVEVYDSNTLWSRWVMRHFKRPAETDVERVQALISSPEVAIFENLTDYVATGSPVNMDAQDYAGQMVNSVMDDCAQQSGKNWFVQYIKNAVNGDREMCVFYGDYTYDSPLSITNDRAEWVMSEIVDGSAIVWPFGKRTTLRRDPSRVFSGAFGEYEKGRLYRRRESTEEAFALGYRDMIVPMPNVKTKTKANARLQKALDHASTQDERITTEVVLPNAKATMIKAGMRLRFKATHLPGYEDWVLMRVLNAIPTPIAGGNKYRIALELQGPGQGGGTEIVFGYMGTTANEPNFYPTDWTELISVYANTAPYGGTEPNQGVTLAYGPGTNGNPQSIFWQHSGGAVYLTVCGVQLAQLDEAGPSGAVGELYPAGTAGSSIDVTATGPGAIIAVIRAHNYDQAGVYLMDPPDGFVVVHERTGFGDREHGGICFGYMPVSSAGTYTLSWGMYSPTTWDRAIAAVFVPTVGPVVHVQDSAPDVVLGAAAYINFPNPL